MMPILLKGEKKGQGSSRLSFREKSEKCGNDVNRKHEGDFLFLSSMNLAKLEGQIVCNYLAYLAILPSKNGN